MSELLPHNLDAERAALGSALISSSKAWPVLSAIVRAEDFYRGAHAEIFSAMLRVTQRGAPLDLLIVTDDLKSAGKLEEVGGPAYVAGLTDGVPSSMNVEHYAHIVLAQSQRRALVAAAEWMRDEALRAEMEVPLLADSATRRLLSVVRATGTSTATAGEAAQAYITQLLDDGAKGGILTGLEPLDQFVITLRKRQLTVLVGRPSMGKSSLALAIAASVAERVGPVGYIAPGQDSSLLAGRLLGWRSGNQQSDIEGGEAQPSDYARVLEAVSTLESMPLRFATSARTAAEAAAWGRRLTSDGGCLVVVDWLQQLLPVRDNRKRSDEDVAMVTRTMKQLAAKNNVAVLLVSRLDRAPDSRLDKRPHLGELRGSGALDQDTDVAVILHRDERRPRKGKQPSDEAIVARNHGGRTGPVRLRWNHTLARWDAPEPEML